MFNQINYSTYSAVLDGCEGYFLSSFFNKNNKTILYVAQNEKQIAKLANEILYFAPDANIIQFFAYDCLPYDRLSPSRKNVGKRIEELNNIINISKPKIILTTINALMQKVIPKKALKDSTKKMIVGEKINREELFTFLISNGYLRAEVASEPGSFAVRGSIVDIFDAKEDMGYRLDFLGNTIEKIKLYDGITQISTNNLDNITLLPASEIIFNDEYVENFKRNYKKLFSTSALNDSLYESASKKIKIQALEHWLPLFYNKLDSLFDYIPTSSMIFFDNFSEVNFSEQDKSINDYLESRKLTLKMTSYADDFKYYPVPKELMWLDKKDFEDKIKGFTLGKISPFKETNDNSIEQDFTPVPNFHLQSQIQSKTVFDLVKEYKKKVQKKIIISAGSLGSQERLINILESNNLHSINIINWSDYKNVSGKSIGTNILPIHKGFATQKFALISEQDLFGEKITRSVKSTKKLENLLSEAARLNKGELVVHTTHGIGRFEGLQTVDVSGIKHDFLLIVYDGGDKLFLPVENIEIISRYGDDENGKLDKLGNSNWQERKAKIKNRIKDIAKDLLKVAAERQLRRAQIIVPVESLYDEFCARFPYVETEDQLSAIEDVENDLASGKPVDRLICGDVGFGKTEIALRAAFMATNTDNLEKAQVAIVVPTTLLAVQHYETFIKRFAGFAVKIKQLSRLVTKKENILIKKEIEDGDVDIVIGTHALLSKDIKFHNLQLLIIDEEQHFGVAQKERLKQLRSDIHVMTLSATPIPRTMQMSFVGIKDLSLIATPPVDRMVIKTSIMPFDKVVVREAILKEYFRGGKCFYVAPRVSDLLDIKRELEVLTPQVKSVIAHGQMKSTELDKIMHDFCQGKYDILISTTIIESGLDIPLANTIFIHRADMFGLSALYQLRGRVGRGNIRAYAYLLLPKNKKPSKVALKRLEVMQTLDSLGAGFSIATHDMDIRGFGNLLGEEQSGQVKEVGVELYQSMLKEAIEEIKDNVKNDTFSWSPQINIGISVLIPEDYISEIHLRMSLYRRIAALNSEEEIESFKTEMIDRFGKFPVDVDHLLTTVKLKILCKKANIEKIDAGEKGVVLTFRDNNFAAPDKLLAFVIQRNNVKIKPDGKLVFIKSHDDISKRTAFIFNIINEIMSLI